MPQPLPKDLPPHLDHSGKIEGIRKAYSTLLRIQETTSSTNVDNKKSLGQKLMHIRTVGYLIREGPSLTASEFVAEEVNSCENEDQIDKAGEKYILHYLRPFRRFKGRTPSQSSQSSHAEFETKEQMMVEILRKTDGPPRNYSEAKKHALIRDGFQCIVSGRYDSKFVDRNHELEEEIWNSRLQTCVTQCAYIIPYSTNTNTSTSKDTHEYTASVWAILECFGYEELPERLKVNGIHCLDNVMTLDLSVHDWFDRLELWFEAVEGSPNTYIIKTTKRTHLNSCKTIDGMIT